jgi:beta-1,4-mannosyltransferase
VTAKRRPAKAIRVLQSYPTPRPNRNPYTALMTQSLQQEPAIDLRLFTWRNALLSSFDVFHVHWPETKLRGSSQPKSFVLRLLYALLLLKIWICRIPVVRTAHNLELPQGISRTERWLIELTNWLTTLRIALNTTTTFPSHQAFEVIPHGHYREWYARYDRESAIPGRVSFVGLIRRYKGVDTLIRAFHELDRPDASLVIAGAPSTDELASSLVDEAAGDPRVRLDLRLLDDLEFVAVVCQSQVVALPYREMHNSAGALTALSLDRPVLVPRNTVNERLSDEVGPGWVHLYDGDLTEDDLSAVLSSSAPSASQPDLSARDWSHCGPRHLTAYRRALELRRAGLRRRR